MKKYDVVVVGAGLGGLSAATRLAKGGKKVLLLERHNVPGGYATSFVRGRYEFEVALHALSGMGSADRRGGAWKYLASLGVAQRIELVKMKHIYRSIFPGVDVSLPDGREAYESTLCATFPAEADGIRRFLKRVFDLQAEVSEVEEAMTRSQPGPEFFLKAPFRMPTTLRFLPATLAQVLDRDVKDPTARGVLSQYWGYFGLPPSRVSFLYFATALASYVNNGATYVKGRSQALSNAFVAAFQELGGDIRTGCGVKSIRVRDGRVAGVVTDGDEEYPADHVVSNASPVATCRDLIGVDKVPAAFFQGLRTATDAPSSVNVYLGVGRPLAELGLHDHETFAQVDADLDSHHDTGSTLEPPKGIALAHYNEVWPEMSPPGTSILSITALYRAQPWLTVAPERYEEVKERIADQMIGWADRIVPGLRAHSEVVSVATPLTNMRYTGNPSGSIYGFDNHPWFQTILRPGPRGPIAGLWFCGAWTQPGGGFEPCMLSGRFAAESVLAAGQGR